MNYKNILIVSICFALSNANENRQEVPSFFHLINEPYFVDKTEVLRYLFNRDYNQTPWTPVYYVVCPRGFGKRTNLLMIKAFAELEVDDETKYIKPWMKTTAALFFTQLNIGRYTDVMIKHLAQHPVIYLDFQISTRSTMRSIERVLNDMLVDAIEDYRWLADHLLYNMGPRVIERRWYMHQEGFEDTYWKVFNVEKDSAEPFINMFQEDLSSAELDWALYHIGKVLYGYFGNTKVVLLVENFQHMALHSFSICKYIGLRVYWIINTMLDRALRYSDCFEFVMITSTGGIANAIQNPSPFLDEHMFTNYFGFLAKDVISLCFRYNISKKYRDKILSYGYLTASKDRKIYQQSTTIDLIMDVYQYDKILPYSHYEWTDPKWHGFIASFLQVSDKFLSKIETLLKGNSFKYYISKQLHRGTFSEFMTICSSGFNVEIYDEQIDQIFNLCLGLGYFSHAPGTIFNYTFPNPGVKQLLKDSVNKWAHLHSTIMACSI